MFDDAVIPVVAVLMPEDEEVALHRRLGILHFELVSKRAPGRECLVEVHVVDIGEHGLLRSWTLTALGLCRGDTDNRSHNDTPSIYARVLRAFLISIAFRPSALQSRRILDVVSFGRSITGDAQLARPPA
jgi:hypothetical protein